ncbi:hypothetical protein [Brevibacillus dissolubilis]|uniref:hypothetical protein n=1 Tax=Brevibacillus dissolubilis TaxID=1844116 RepID=UPI001116DC75|nr:hypothetical protein [Brevibacillus dissolubilis]
MNQLNHLFAQLSHDYLLIAIAAVLFFIGKAITGYITYKQINKKFQRLEQKLDELLRRQS